MNDNAYQRIQPSTSSPSLSAVLVDPSPNASPNSAAQQRRRTYSKHFFWKLWRGYKKPTINIDKLVRMRLRWRTVAKILGGILFFKISLSILGSLVGSEPSEDYMVMPDGAVARDVFNDPVDEIVNLTTTPPPPPPPIPIPSEAFACDNLKDYIGMVSSAPEVDRFQTIQLGISFGFSAYYDDRLDGKASIKVMALADEWLDARPPLCQLWFPERVEPFALQSNVTNFPAQPTARYKSVMYTCSYTISDPEMPAPIAVSMSSEACGQPLSMFKPHLLDKTNPPENKQKFTVCLASPLRLNFSEPGEMVDWIEVHKIFGVTKYVMYDNSVADNVRPFMNYYSQTGLLDVVQWKLPSEIKDPRESVKAFGQLTMINDCLYRNMYKSKYLVFLDLDEMMVPRGMAKTLEEVLVTTSCQEKAQTIIRSAFFRKQWTNDEKYASDERMVKRSLVSLLKTKRERKVLAINVHAKYIVIPELIEALEQLAALKFISTVGNNTGEATCIPLAKECLLHHYRYYDEFMGDWMIDRKMHEFTKLIVERTGAVHEAVQMLMPNLMSPNGLNDAPAIDSSPPQVDTAEAAPAGDSPPAEAPAEEPAAPPADSPPAESPPADSPPDEEAPAAEAPAEGDAAVEAAPPAEEPAAPAESEQAADAPAEEVPPAPEAPAGDVQAETNPDSPPEENSEEEPPPADEPPADGAPVV